MRKSLLKTALFCLLASYSFTSLAEGVTRNNNGYTPAKRKSAPSSKFFRMKTNVLGLPFGLYSASFEFKVHKHIAIGGYAGYLRIFPFLAVFQGGSFGAHALFSPGHEMFSNGWTLNIGGRVNTGIVDGIANGTFGNIDGGAAYEWYFGAFNINLGFGFTYFIFPSMGSYVPSPILPTSELSMGFAI